MPDEEYDDGAHDGSDQAGALVRPIPADHLPDERGKECAHDAKNSRKNKAGRIICAGSEEPCDNPGEKPDDDDPENIHDEPPNAEVPPIERRVGFSVPVNARESARSRCGFCATVGSTISIDTKIFLLPRRELDRRSVRRVRKPSQG